MGTPTDGSLGDLMDSIGPWSTSRRFEAWELTGDAGTFHYVENRVFTALDAVCTPRGLPQHISALLFEFMWGDDEIPMGTLVEDLNVRPGDLRSQTWLDVHVWEQLP